MNSLLHDLLSTGKVRDASGQEYPLQAHISQEVGSLISSVVHSARPRTSLEIGLAHGVSSLFICEALRKVGASKHYIIDPNQSSEWNNIGLSNLTIAGFSDLIELRETMSHVALPDLLKEGVRIDFAFIDGWHVFDQVIVDFFYVDKMLRVGGLIAFDDCEWPSIQKALRYILTNRRYSVVAQSESVRASRRERAIMAAYPLSRYFAKWLKPELTEPGRRLGISAGKRCIVMKKLQDDERAITYHCPF